MEFRKNCPLCNHAQFEDYISCRDFLVSGENFTIQQCVNCDFKFTNPFPSKDEIGKYYQSQEYISHSGTKKGIINALYHIARKFSIRRKYKIISHLHPSSGKILDFGCGTGEFLTYMKNKNWDCTGVEPNEHAGTFAEKNYSLNVFSELAHQHISTSAHSFHIITLWHVLEHSHDLNESLEKFYQLLNDNGYLIIAVPNHESYDAEIYKKYWAGWDLPRHLYHFSYDTLINLVSKHKFYFVKTFPMKLDAYYVSMLSEKYKRGNILKAIWHGWNSNSFARQYPKRYSSLIYIFKK